MPDDLYDRDALAWSERQAELLRRVARGERVNDVDWDHVVEEIEDVGLAELHAVESYLEQLLAHLLKLRGWPNLGASNHWRGEIATFQAGAVRRFAPSMRQRIDLAGLYATAVQQIEPRSYGGVAAPTAPATCPVTLDQLLGLPRAELEAAFSTVDAGC
jgi:predicted nucleotidyltransferase